MVVRNWAEVLAGSLQDVWLQLIGFVPELIGALVVFIVGLIVAAGLGTLVEQIVAILKLDQLLAKLGIEEYFERAGLRLNAGRFFGQVVYWFIVIAALLAASDILHFATLSSFLKDDVLPFVPRVIVAVVILLVSVVVANFLRKVVKSSVLSARLHAADFLGALTWWAVIILGFSQALLQLGLKENIIDTIIAGIIAMFALAGGIAFGLGGKEYASNLLGRFQKQVEGK